MSHQRTPRAAMSGCRRMLAAGATCAVAAALVVTTVAFAPAAEAQQAPSSKPPSASTKSAKSAAKSDGAATPAAGEGGLKTRVEQLEEQLVDMQVVIGTLESLAKNGAAASPAAAPRSSGGGGGGNDTARLDSIETQVRALSQQVEQLSEQMRRRSDAGASSPPPAAASPTRFGATTTAPSGDPIGSLISGGGGNGNAPAVPVPVSQSQLKPVVAGPEAAGGGDPANTKQLYETAYGHLLQQDYGAAEVAFDDFLKKYPSDPLAGNAQYWLGESFFVRGQYKQAAGAFLKGYQTYGKSAKAPDSLLKLAMSLDRLGQKDAACSSYGELSTRFPTAAPHIKSRAQSERQRLACS